MFSGHPQQWSHQEKVCSKQILQCITKLSKDDSSKEPQFPSDIFKCPASKKEKVTTAAADFGKDEYANIVKEIIGDMDALQEQ